MKQASKGAGKKADKNIKMPHSQEAILAWGQKLAGEKSIVDRVRDIIMARQEQALVASDPSLLATRAELAETIGLSGSQVYRILRKLKAKRHGSSTNTHYYFV